MRVRWDEAKRQRVFAEREIDFEQLRDLLYTPYLEDQRSEQPEQYRMIGFANGQLTTFIVEYRIDEVGEYIWIVTVWKATQQERERMSSESTEIKDIEEIAQQAHAGADVSEHFTGHFQVKQQISVDFSLELLRSIDAECQQHNISRQDWIKMVCAERIREVQASKMSKII